MSTLYKVHLVAIKVIHPTYIALEITAFHGSTIYNGSYTLPYNHTDLDFEMRVQAFAEYYNLAILTEQIVTVDLRNK